MGIGDLPSAALHAIPLPQARHTLFALYGIVTDKDDKALSEITRQSSQSFRVEGA